MKFLILLFFLVTVFILNRRAAQQILDCPKVREQVTFVLPPADTVKSFDFLLDTVSGQVNCPTCRFLSQSGEDHEFIALFMKDRGVQSAGDRNLFEDLPRGQDFVVVEMGALDGSTFSNSFFYEYYLGWTAVLIEPSPSAFQDLKRNRPKAINVNAACCQETKLVEFIENSAVGGIQSEMSARFLDTFYKSKPSAEMKRKVQCLPISMILNMMGIKKINIFFLDVEGSELSVLSGFDFENVQMDYIIIEMDGGNADKETKIRKLLADNGIHYVQKIGQGRNELFRNIKVQLVNQKN